MTPEERELLKETAELTKENNEILLSLRRSARISTVMRVVYWLVIILLSFGAYYFIQPYIDIFIKSYSGMQQNVDLIKSGFKLPALPAALSGKK
jgi:hypothetical protein